MDSSAESVAAAQVVEALGWPVIWLSGGPLPGLQTISDLVGATSTIKFVSGILAVVKYSAADVSTTYAELEATAPGRFTAGLGGAHGAKPLATLAAYLDELDVPVERRLLAALGPRMLKLAGERTAGAFPFLTTAAYSAEARKVLGPDRLLAVSHLAVVETDADRARAIARNTISFFTTIPGYVASLQRQGFSQRDMSELPDHMVDSLAAWGSPADIRSKLSEHLDAGADHVAVNVITGVTGPQPVEQWRVLTPALIG